MTTAPLRVAVAGAGIIAGVHLANLATLEGVELCGLADLDVDRARALAPPGVPVHPRAEALLDAELAPGDVVLFKSSRDAGLRLLGDRLARPSEELT